MSKSVSLSTILLLIILAPCCAWAELNLDHGMQYSLTYGDAELDNLYAHTWDGESLELSLSSYDGYYGIGIGYQFVDAELNRPTLSGTYSSNGLEILFLFSPGTPRFRPYAGLGAGVHYNHIELEGDKTFEKSGVGGRLVGKAGLKLFLLSWQMGNKEANLILGGYAKYYLSEDLFFESEDDHFGALLYGGELGVRIDY